MTPVPSPVPPFPVPPTPSTRSRGCLVGLAVGNTLGLDVEGCDRASARAVKGAEGPLLLPMQEDDDHRWDDDLAMAAVLGELLLQHGAPTDPLDEPALGAAFVTWHRTNGRGIGSHTARVLRALAAGRPEASREVWEDAIQRNRRPLGNGCVMRIAPLGLRFAADPACIPALAAQASAVTHWDPICRQGAGAIALLTAALLRGEADPLAFARTHLGDLCPEVAEALHPLPLADLEARGLDGPDRGSTLLAIQVAVSVLASGLPYAEALPWVLRQGGDTDTLGAIVGALLGTRDGLAAIPAPWRAGVRREPTLLRLGEALLARSGWGH